MSGPGTLHVVTGASGKVGGATARALLAAGAVVRVVLRDPAKAQVWHDAGATVVIADLRDAASSTLAMQGASHVFAMNPPDYAAPDMFAAADAVAEALRIAIAAAAPGRVVVLSSVGAQHAAGTGNIRTAYLLERRLAEVPGVSFLRAAWFMENWRDSVLAARADGRFPSLLQHLDAAIPMVATEDIGAAAAALLHAPADGARVVELAGPAELAPRGVAQAASALLGRTVEAVAMPPQEIEPFFRGFGHSESSAASWAEMLRGFDGGLIRFERPAGLAHGSTTISRAIATMIEGVPA